MHEAAGSILAVVTCHFIVVFRYPAGALRLELATSPKSLYINGPPDEESAPLRAL